MNGSPSWSLYLLLCFILCNDFEGILAVMCCLCGQLQQFDDGTSLLFRFDVPFVRDLMMVFTFSCNCCFLAQVDATNNDSSSSKSGSEKKVGVHADRIHKKDHDTGSNSKSLRAIRTDG